MLGVENTRPFAINGKQCRRYGENDKNMNQIGDTGSLEPVIAPKMFTSGCERERTDVTDFEERIFNDCKRLNELRPDLRCVQGLIFHRVLNRLRYDGCLPGNSFYRDGESVKVFCRVLQFSMESGSVATLE